VSLLLSSLAHNYIGDEGGLSLVEARCVNIALTTLE
jgi:hypothetical protein